MKNNFEQIPLACLFQESGMVLNKGCSEVELAGGAGGNSAASPIRSMAEAEAVLEGVLNQAGKLGQSAANVHTGLDPARVFKLLS